MTWAPPPRPAWVEDLLAAVERAFAVTGAATPTWPDPWAGRRVPEEAYSRLEDREKYLVLDSRVAAWTAVLVERGLASAHDGGTVDWEGTSGVRGGTDAEAPAAQARLVPVRDGALSLAVARHSVRPDGFGVDLGVVAPGDDAPVLLEFLPGCGCDACDDGSAELLEALDERVLAVLRGGVLHARHGADSITSTFDGWSGTGSSSADWLDEAVPAPPGVRRWLGAPWL